MSINTASEQVPVFPFAGAITRKQFFLVQRLLLPWWGTMPVTALMLVCCAWMVDAGGNDPTDTPMIKLLSTLIWAAGMILLVWGIVTFARRRQWRQVEATQQEIRGTIGEAGLEWSTPMTTSKFPWSKIIKVRQHPEMLLMFYSANCAFYVPKRFFATETAWNEANALALRQLPASSKRIRGE
jgi:hypothetical protein